MSSTHLEIRNILTGDLLGIMPDSTDTLTNKTLDDYTNFIHADGVHLRVKATTAVSYGDCLSFVGFNSGEQAIEVKKRDSLSEPVIGISHDTLTIGEFGMAVSNGLVRGVDTSAFSEGTILYGNATGGFTNTPTINDTNYNQALAYVVRSHAVNGEIMVNVGHGHEKASQISYGTGTVKDVLDSLGTAATRDVPVSGNASSTELVKGDDTRLTDARTPTAHTHTTSDITNLASYTGLDVRYYTKTEVDDLSIALAVAL